MHQHPIVGYIIGMIVLDLEIIDLDGAFEQFVLDLFKLQLYPLRWIGRYEAAAQDGSPG